MKVYYSKSFLPNPLCPNSAPSE